MFKWFKDFLTVTEKRIDIGMIASVEREKKLSFNNAKQFADDLSSDVYVLKQFFDITPKIGKFGSLVKTEDTTVLTLNDEFMPGVKITFYVDPDGIKGFQFTETGE